MAEYIKKDELLKFKTDVYDEDGHVLYAVPTGHIVAIPPADVAPVVHGMWEYEEPTINTYGMVKCTVCNWWSIDPYVSIVYHYCPNCGAKMDGGAD